MLSRRYRLTREEFNLVRQSANWRTGRLFGLLLFCLPNSPKSPNFPNSPVFPKAGLIVSTKLSPKAVIRNQLKRRLRAALQSVLPVLKKPIHFIILPNRRALSVSVKELEIEIISLLKSFNPLIL